MVPATPELNTCVDVYKRQSHDRHRSAVGHQAAVRSAPSLDVEKLRTRSRSNFAPHHVAIVCGHGSSHCALLPDDCMALLAYQPCDCRDMASFTPGLRDRSSGRPRLLPVLTVNARSTTRKVQGVTTPQRPTTSSKKSPALKLQSINDDLLETLH